jgi:hypothetical protein
MPKNHQKIWTNRGELVVRANWGGWSKILGGVCSAWSGDRLLVGVSDEWDGDDVELAATNK